MTIFWYVLLGHLLPEREETEELHDAFKKTLKLASWTVIFDDHRLWACSVNVQLKSITSWRVGIRKAKIVKSEVAQSCPTLCDPMDTRLLRPWDFLSKNTGVGCHFLLQGVFLTQGSNPGLPHCRQTLYRLSHQGSERTCVHLLIRHFLSTLGLMLRMQRKSRKGFCPRFIFS